MKFQPLILFIFCFYMVVLSACNSTTETPAPVAKVTYNADIKPILVANCGACHLAGGTHAKKWDTYATAKANILLILDRVQRTSTSTGFMPQGKAPLSSETIGKLKQWQIDGALEM